MIGFQELKKALGREPRCRPPRLIDCACCGEGPAWTDGRKAWCDACLEVYPFTAPQGYIPPRVMPAEVLLDEASRSAEAYLTARMRTNPPRQAGLFGRE